MLLQSFSFCGIEVPPPQIPYHYQDSTRGPARGGDPSQSPHFLVQRYAPRATTELTEIRPTLQQDANVPRPS